MLATKGYAAMAANERLQPFSFERRDVGPHNVLITISHCGICHSDIHQVRNEWGIALFPMVPGHEIVGTVSQVGSAVTTFKVGDRVGVGCLWIPAEPVRHAEKVWNNIAMEARSGPTVDRIEPAGSLRAATRHR